MEFFQDPVALTRKLLAFDTVNPPGREASCNQYLGELLEAAGYAISYHDFDQGRTSLMARRNGMGKKAAMCFSGHIDTIPLGRAAWRWDPLGAETEGDKLFGRGASDMKSGVAAMVTAAIEFARLPAGDSDLLLIISAGEETGCQGARYLASQAERIGPVGAMVVGEPTNNYPIIGHKGALWIRARFSGKAAHGSMPEQGDNAVYKAARAVNALAHFDFGMPAHPVLGFPTLNVGTISGGVNINSVPDQATIGIDIRSIPDQSHDEILYHIRKALGPGVEMERLEDARGVATDPAHEWVQKVFGLTAPFLGAFPEPKGVTYFTDASALTVALGNPPTIILGPGDPAMAHKTDEFCLISNITQAAEMYLVIARNWLNI